jgi:uncharacterized protein GlcG (DUF336 family)
MKIPMLCTTALAALAACGSALAQAAPPPPAKGPAMAIALEAAQVALKTCTDNGYKVSVAVVDTAGVQKVLLAGDGVHAMGVGSSVKKAATAVAYKMSTADVGAKAKADAEFGAKVKADAAAITWPGGQLLTSGGEIIGAIGVGGAPGGDKDDICAMAAIAKVKDRL